MDRFREIDTWIFDLDDTLYPHGCDLFTHLQARMNLFIEQKLGLTTGQAMALRLKYLHAYGTSLKGMMAEHQTEPQEFLDFIHQVDYGVLLPNPRLRDAIEKLPGRKIIYTNASQDHVDKVLSRLGLMDLFAASFDIINADFVPKPNTSSFEMFCSTYDIEPAKSVFFEDSVANLATAKDYGLTTVLVNTPSSRSDPALSPDAVDFAIDDPVVFLETIIASHI